MEAPQNYCWFSKSVIQDERGQQQRKRANTEFCPQTSLSSMINSKHRTNKVTVIAQGRNYVIRANNSIGI